MLKNLSLEEQSEGIVSVTVTVDKDSVQEYYTKSVNKVKDQAKIKGFRNGKAPLNLVKQIYEPQIRYETINAVFPSIYEIIEKEHHIKAIATPEITGFEDYKIGEDLNLTIVIECAPKIKELASLESVSIKQIEYEYKEEDMLNKELEILQSVHAHYHDIEENVSLGDFVKASVSMKGENIEKPNISSYFLLKESDDFYALSSHFVGKKIGETYKENITFPSAYKDEELQNKTVEVEFKIEEGKTIHQPDINDELASRFGHDSLEALKENIKKVLKERVELNNLFDTAENIYTEIAKQSQFSISEKVVLNQTQSELQNKLSQIMKYQSMDNFLKEKNLSQEDFIEESKKTARLSIEKYLITQALKKEFNISTTKEEVNNFVQEIADQEVVNKKEIVDYYNKNEDKKENLKNQLELKLLAKALIKKVNITGIEKKPLESRKEEQ